MQVRSKIISAWRNLFQRRRIEGDLNDELRVYLEEQIERKVRSGQSPEKARREALIEFGGLEQVKDACRDVRRLRWSDGVSQDVRYALRTLFRHRGITIISLVSLALGIGVNTLVFSFFSTLLIRPLPYPESDRLVVVRSILRGNPQQKASLSRSDCAVLRADTSAFENFGCDTGDAWSSVAGTRPGDVAPERLPGQRFTAGLARALSRPPLVGRWFTDAEEQEAADPVVVISYGLWQRRFGGAPDVLGKALRIDGAAATIIGVMSDEFEFMESNADYWVPFRNPPAGLRTTARVLSGIARLKPGTDIRAAQAAMEAFSLHLEEQSPELNKGRAFVLTPLRDVYVSSEYRDAALIPGGAVAFVLMIACANVSGLLLAQGATQHKELSVRAALGSGRWRIIRQALTHSILLGALGGVLGLATGWAGMEFVRKSLPSGLPHALYSLHLDGFVLTFTVFIALVSGVIAGVVPALQISRIQPLDVLKETSQSATAGVSRQRLRSVFVVIQIALAFVLLVGAGLMINGLLRASSAPLGFDPDDLLTVEIQLPDNKFRQPTNKVLASGGLEMRIDPLVQLTTERIRRNLAAIPGVTIASAIAIHPPLGGALNMPIRLDGRQFQEQLRAQFIPITPDYFRTLQMPVTQGREFETLDTTGSVPVALINETMARRYWPNQSPLGERVQVDTVLLPNEPPRQIVGVVSDVMQYSGQEDRPQVYLPFNQLPLIHDERLSNDLRNITFIVRTSQPMSQIAGHLAGAVTEADSSQAVSRIRTMRDTAFAKEVRRFLAELIGTFGAIAVMLAVVGVYGVMAQTVSQRTNEIGIRMALGANTSDVRLLVIGHGCVIIATGLLIGTLGALAVTRVLRSYLLGLSPTDPLTFLLGLGVLGIIALLACYIPARRASRIDPMLALRHE
jgi:putative ABC transport system permease protein